jgi:hypothetical protein
MDTNGDQIYAWGAQLEVGSEILYDSSYIETTTAAATRNIDVLAYAASNFFDYYPNQGSVSFWFAPKWDTELNGLARHFFNLQGLNANTTLNLDTSEQLVLGVGLNTGGQVTATSSAVTMTEDTFYYIVVTWDTTTTNGLNVYFNGSLVGTSSNSAFALSPRGTNFYLGSDGSTNSCDGIIDEFEIRKDVLNQAQISNYYNSGRAHGWRRNYYSSMLIDQSSYEPTLLEGGWRFDIPLVLKEVLT